MAPRPLPTHPEPSPRAQTQPLPASRTLTAFLVSLSLSHTSFLAGLGSAALAAPVPSSTFDAETLFTQVTEGPMLTDTGPFESSFWVDYDHDGFLDLFLTGGQETTPSASGFKNALYRNKGDGTFDRMSNSALVSATTHAGSQSWGDFDNDGFIDVFIAQWGSRKGVLLRNAGQGLFTSLPANLSVSQGDWPLAVWTDANNDGFLDLCHAISNRNLLIPGTADGMFGNPLPLDSAGGWNRTAADFDNDGHVDVIINLAPEGRPALFRNLGNGTFRRISTGDIATQGVGFWSMAWGDYDNDGFLDLFAGRGPNGDSSLLHNERDGTFRTVRDSGLVLATISYNPHWADFDNDGHLDLFVSGDSGVPSSLYHNNGDGKFTQVTTGVIATDIQADIYGPSWGDYDNNGFLDLFVINQGGPNHLYRNNGNGNAWIQFILVGTASNRSGIGAKVRVQATLQGKDHRQMRELIASDGVNGPGTLRTEFGLGSASKVDLVRIEWPSGTIQEFRDVAPRQILTVTEPSRLSAPQRKADNTVQFNLVGAAGVPFTVEASSNLVTWTPFLTVTNRSRQEVIVDSDPTSHTRYYRAAGPRPKS